MAAGQGSAVPLLLDPAGPGGFDVVSLDIYTDYWRKHGARIGRRVGENVEWEDGVCQPIPLPRYRFVHPEGRTRHADDEWTWDGSRR